ncbi:MAG: hypothetical protein FJ096_05285 [Deltaproteobacteria bacterium]|nr:hypothetical protein [Deltaproteobacteria bacterium]
MRPSTTAWLSLLALPLFSAFCGGKSIVEEGTGGAAGATGATGTGATGPGATGTTSGGGPGFAACDAPGTCTLALDTCCGPCGMPTLDDVDAIGEGAAEAHRAAVCPDPSGPCPACAQQLNPTLFAYCDLAAKGCVEADLPLTEFAACAKDEDCGMRLGLGCCECGASGEWVAVASARRADLEALLCKQDEACANCAPEPPEGVTPACEMGRCVLKPVVPPGG